MNGDNLPPPKEVVELIKDTYIDSVKLYNADGKVLAALANTGISVVLGVENELIPPLARSPYAAQIWVKQHIKPFYPATSITAIAVGNEVLTGDDKKLMALLVPAMNNLQLALLGMDVHEKIKISTPSSMAVLAISSPPSLAAFKPQILPYAKQVLQFLAHTGSAFMVNAYPYFAYASDPKGVSLDYALFASKQGVKDPHTGFTYGSLFDAQIDAVHFAINAVGFKQHIPVIVSETGWPSNGDKNETGATMQNAQIYNSNLIKRVKSGVGTPLYPQEAIPTYIFALFNENEKPGPSSERNFGLFQPSKAVVYDAGLTKVQPSSGNSNGYLPSPSGTQPQQGPSAVWCVAKPGASEAQLQQIINFACGEGGADCAAIQNGQNCFSPNTLEAHASYAMNSYYQHHGRNYWNCFFDSAGLLTPTNPSYGTCTYPSQ
ncbi:hypothetical protein KP509_12G017700 [Ceratopteris richardii]|nr:hypothetical protein KP509_12G017700 [Ceratopteris richardii]